MIKLADNIKHYVPGSVFTQSAFIHTPFSFETLAPTKLGSFPAITQAESFANFQADPTRPLLYLVTGKFDALKARYFAAYLMSIYLKHVPNGNAIWTKVWPTSEEEIEFESYYNPQLHKADPDFLVVEGLEADSDPIMLEKVRDLLNKWTVPRILIGVGMDPVYLSWIMRMPTHAFAYFGHVEQKELKL